MSFWRAANFCVLLLGALPVYGATIVDTGVGSNGPAVFASQFEEQGWTQTQTYTNVSIQVALYSWTPGMTFTGTAYLTNALGSGANPSIVDSEPYAGETPDTTPETITLFSGLSLGPGTYFLTLASTDDAGSLPGAIWSDCPSSPCSPASAPGVTLLSQNFAVGTKEDPSFPPDSNFSEASQPLNLTVTGSPAAASAPEPSGFAAILAAIAAWVGLAPTLRRRRRCRG